MSFSLVSKEEESCDIKSGKLLNLIPHSRASKLVLSILRKNKDLLGMNGKTEVVSSCFRKRFVSTSAIRRKKKKTKKGVQFK